MKFLIRQCPRNWVWGIFPTKKNEWREPLICCQGKNVAHGSIGLLGKCSLTPVRWCYGTNHVTSHQVERWHISVSRKGDSPGHGLMGRGAVAGGGDGGQWCGPPTKKNNEGPGPIPTYPHAHHLSWTIFLYKKWRCSAYLYWTWFRKECQYVQITINKLGHIWTIMHEDIDVFFFSFLVLFPVKSAVINFSVFFASPNDGKNWGGGTLKHACHFCVSPWFPSPGPSCYFLFLSLENFWTIQHLFNQSRVFWCKMVCRIFNPSIHQIGTPWSLVPSL